MISYNTFLSLLLLLLWSLSHNHIRVDLPRVPCRIQPRGSFSISFTWDAERSINTANGLSSCHETLRSLAVRWSFANAKLSNDGASRSRVQTIICRTFMIVVYFRIFSSLNFLSPKRYGQPTDNMLKRRRQPTDSIPSRVFRTVTAGTAIR